MTRTAIHRLIVLMCLGVAAGQAFGSVQTPQTLDDQTGNLNSLNGYAFNWGTIGTDAGWNPPGTTGKKLVWDSFAEPSLGSSMVINSANRDSKQDPYDYSAPANQAQGEYWDVEGLAIAATGVTEINSSGIVTKADKFHFLVVLSTNSMLFDHNGVPIAVGDLGITMRDNVVTTAAGTTHTQRADLGVKLAGSDIGEAKQNAKFGYGLNTGGGTWDGAKAEERDPLVTAIKYNGSGKPSGDLNPGGFRPGDVMGTKVVGGVEQTFTAWKWGSNFDAGAGSDLVSVSWHKLYEGGTADLDGPNKTKLDGNGDGDYADIDTIDPITGQVIPNFDTVGLNTYAIEVTVDGSYFPNGVGIVSYAPSCLNNGLQVDGGGGKRVPQLPPSFLLGIVPAIALMRRKLGK